MMGDETQPRRYTSEGRPKTGLAAWESTVGYIAGEISPDALLTLRAYPEGMVNQWEAMVEWGVNREKVSGAASLSAALDGLWKLVNQGHIIFSDIQEAFRAPVGYSQSDWVDEGTTEALERLLWVVRVVFRSSWTLVMLYQPTDNPETRVQVRLIAGDSDVYIGGRGASLRDAAMQLYRNATPTSQDNQT